MFTNNDHLLHILWHNRFVRFNQGPPTSPFALVKVTDFDIIPRYTASLPVPTVSTGLKLELELEFEEEHDAADLPEPTESDETYADSGLVDGILSCRFHLHCTLVPKAGSRFCFLHHRIYAEILSRIGMLDAEGRVGGAAAERRPADFFGFQSNVDYQNQVTFHQPPDHEFLPFRRLKEMHDKYEVWTVDTEFGTLSGYNQIPYAIAVRNAKTDKIILSSAVDYNSMLLTDMEDLFRQIREEYTDSDLPTYLTRQYFQQFYIGLTICGLSLGAIGDLLRAKGFSLEIHRILSWYCTIDVAAFNRCILGDDHLISRLNF